MTPKNDSLLTPNTFEHLKQVTPLSKYFAMIIFIIIPFIGGIVGYNYALEKNLYLNSEDSLDYNHNISSQKPVESPLLLSFGSMIASNHLGHYWTDHVTTYKLKDDLILVEHPCLKYVYSISDSSLHSDSEVPYFDDFSCFLLKDGDSILSHDLVRDPSINKNFNLLNEGMTGYSVAFYEDGSNYVYIYKYKMHTSTDYLLLEYDIDSNTLMNLGKYYSPINGDRVSPSGRFIAQISDDGKSLYIYDISKKSITVEKNIGLGETFFVSCDGMSRDLGPSMEWQSDEFLTIKIGNEDNLTNELYLQKLYSHCDGLDFLREDVVSTKI